MRKGRSSRTAQFVANLRALGDLAPTVAGFSDPVAEKFLDPRFRRGVARMRARIAAAHGGNPLPRWLRGMGIFNQFRTLVLDRAVLAALPASGIQLDQLVILGAGFDSRAWRLPHLETTIVFEVDHPDTQTVKRERAARVEPRAKEVRFVPADLSHDDLGVRLRDSGFCVDLKSFWVWEGVTMYLAPQQVLQNLRAMAALSSPGSGLAFTYMGKKNGKMPRSLLLAVMGEPVRSAFEPEELAALTRQTGWQTTSNTGIEDWLRAYAPTLALTERNVGLQWGERIWEGRAVTNPALPST